MLLCYLCCVDVQLVPRNYRIHRHCFTGSWSEAELWLKKFPNSYIGVTPLVTHSGGRSLAVREMVANIPLDKLLLETDAPYFIPRQVIAIFEIMLCCSSWVGKAVASLQRC